MNDTLIVTTFVLLDDLMQWHGHRSDVRAVASDSEVLTVAVIAAAQFANHHERALCVLRGMHSLSGSLSLSRLDRRLHALAHWFTLALDLLGEQFAVGAAAFTLDSLPVPVCRRVRAPRCTKVQGSAYYGYCAAKEEQFFGWRLHLVCTGTGVPVGFRVSSGWHAARKPARLESGVRPGAVPAHGSDAVWGQGVPQWRRRSVAGR